MRINLISLIDVLLVLMIFFSWFDTLQQEGQGQGSKLLRPSEIPPAAGRPRKPL